MIVGCLVFSSWASARTWTDKKGREIEAEFVSQDAKSVVLKLPNGKEVTVLFENLSSADLAYLIELETGSPSKPMPADEKPGENPDPAKAPKPAGAWTAPLPLEAKLPAPLVVEEAESGKNVVFTSPNFRLKADSKLKLRVATELLEVYELTRVYCLALPLGLEPGFPPKDGKIEVTSYAKKEDFEMMGGPPGSPSSYSPATGDFSICLENMGLNPTGRSLSGKLEDSLMSSIGGLVFKLSPRPYIEEIFPWFMQGLVQLVSCNKFEKGVFDYRETIEIVKDRLLEMSIGRGEDPVFKKKINIPSLTDVVDVKRPQFADPREQAEYNGRSLLLMTYLLYLDDEGKGTGLRSGLQFMDEFIKNQPTKITAATQEEADKMMEELREKRRQLGEQTTKKIFRDRSIEEVEADMAKAWKAHGLELIFGDGGK